MKTREEKNAYARQWKQENRDHVLELQRSYYHNETEEQRKHRKEYDKEHHSKRRDKYNAHHREWRYGISPDEYNRLFESQNGRCAICGKPQSELKKALHVDHNHDSGEIRGLLCFTCNAGIGFFHDDIEVLRAAVLYLNKE
jgi:hypothetical protein